MSEALPDIKIGGFLSNYKPVPAVSAIEEIEIPRLTFARSQPESEEESEEEGDEDESPPLPARRYKEVPPPPAKKEKKKTGWSQYLFPAAAGALFLIAASRVGSVKRIPVYDPF